MRNREAAGGVLTAEQAPHRPGLPPARFEHINPYGKSSTGSRSRRN